MYEMQFDALYGNREVGHVGQWLSIERNHIRTFVYASYLDCCRMVGVGLVQIKRFTK